MKKYLFLLLLFFIYLFLHFNYETKPVINRTLDKSEEVSQVTLTFDNGKNSYEVKKIFDEYEKDYFIESIKLQDNSLYSLSCSKFKDCINEIYKQNDTDFEINNIVNGIVINNVTFLSYTKSITSYLNNSGLLYTIN